MPDEGDGLRLQKVLAQAGLGSRRVCEDLIDARRVRVNGEVAVLGRRVDPEADVIEVDGRLAWKEAATCQSADGTTRLLFQVVPEPKTAKNRMHLDLHVAEGQRDAEVERLMGLGATFLHDGRQGPYAWVTLADPEGNEFCVA